MKKSSIILGFALLASIALSSCETEDNSTYEDLQSIDKKEIKDQDT